MGSITAADILARAETGWEMSHLQMRGGWPVRFAFWKAARPENGYVLMLPGLGEPIEKRTLRAEEWAARGYQAATFGWRGMGGSGRLCPDDPQKIHIDSFDTYLDDLSEILTQAFLPRAAQGFTVWDAHSTGAHLALRFLGERAAAGPTPDLLIAMAPLVDIKTPPFPAPVVDTLVGAAALIMPKARAYKQRPWRREENPFEGNYRTSDKDNYTWLMDLMDARPELVAYGVSWSWINAQRRSTKALRASLPQVKTPVLALLTPCDPLINGPSQHVLCETLPDCEAVAFADSRHEIYLERPEIAARAWQATDHKLVAVRAKKLGL